MAWHAQTMGSIVASVQLEACSLSLSLLPHSTPFPLAVQPVPILLTSRLPVCSQTRQSELFPMFEVQKQVNVSNFSSSTSPDHGALPASQGHVREAFLMTLAPSHSEVVLPMLFLDI